MRFNKLYEKKAHPEQTAVSSGVQELGTDQWMGTYKFSKDVAGHDGKKQHAPESPSGNDVYTDKPVVVGFSDADDKMTKAAMNGKVKQTVAPGSEEPKDVNASSPLSKNEDVAEGAMPPSPTPQWSDKQNAKRQQSQKEKAKAQFLKKKERQQGVAEGADPESQKLGRIIKKYYNEIYSQGDDALDYLNDRAEQFARVWDIYEGDINSIIADEPAELLRQIAIELERINSELNLDEGYGKYWCSTDKRWKERQGPKQNRNTGEDVEEAQNIYHLNRTGFARGPRDSERHDLDVRRPAPQEWALKINGKVWSKDGKAVTFNSKEQALKVRQSLLAKRPELEVGLVTRGGTAEDQGVAEAHPNSKIYDKCWDGYRKVPGKTRGEPGSCEKIKEDTVDEDVIYRLDKENPMNDTEVLVIGGAGRYSLDGLRAKARREAEQLAKDLTIDHGGAFRRSAQNVRQLQNTLNTIVAAYDELSRLRKLGGVRSKGIKDEDATVVREGLELMEKWTQKYKNSINCSNPKGFSQKAHCAGKKK